MQAFKMELDNTYQQKRNVSDPVKAAQAAVPPCHGVKLLQNSSIQKHHRLQKGGESLHAMKCLEGRQTSREKPAKDS